MSRGSRTVLYSVYSISDHVLLVQELVPRLLNDSSAVKFNESSRVIRRLVYSFPVERNIVLLKTSHRATKVQIPRRPLYDVAFCISSNKIPSTSFVRYSNGWPPPPSFSIFPPPLIKEDKLHGT